uniref:Uncharacterized protein n=1 Tax=Lotus japonicus TaxID=34305 RepID=I3SXH5_LOTJA|nr:unknown [Lotus japonicus]
MMYEIEIVTFRKIRTRMLMPLALFF